MFCSHCGNRLAEGAKICPNCGTHQEHVLELHKDRSKWIWGIVGICILALLIVSTLMMLNIVPIQSLTARFMAVDMTDYIVLEEHEHMLVGEFTDDMDVEYTLEIKDEIDIDGETYYVRVTNFKTNDTDNKHIGLLHREASGDVYVMQGGEMYDDAYTDEDLELISENEGALVMPGKLKLNQTYEVDEGGVETECTLLGFETIELDSGKFRHTAVVEWHYDDEDSPYKEVVHYAKGIGEVKVEGYYWDEDREKWKLDFRLELE